MYTAYVLSDKSRAELLRKFPPKYSKEYAHHVTVEFGVPSDAAIPDRAAIKLVGYVDSEDGLEVLVVSVNGSKKRANGGTYHITWSLDPDKYAPKDSNDIISNHQPVLTLPTNVNTTPQLLK